jgi:glycosyltransferase involved in cell wall biosynthesis
VAVESALSQTVRPEVIVIDDASTDGTSDMLRAEFRGVRAVRVESSQGYIVQRNRGAWLAKADVIVSIDDDAAFPSPHTIAQTLADFDHPRVGAVAIPHVNVNRSPEVVTRAPATDGLYITAAYVGTAHALRRDVFLRLGGYREHLVHQGEESDYCVRMLDAGFVTRLGRADPLHHFESPRRDSERMFVHAARNTILYAWQNVPPPYLPLHWAGNVLNLLRFGVRRRHIDWIVCGMRRGFKMIAEDRVERRPVRVATYRLSRRLAAGEPMGVEEAERYLVPLGERRDFLR